MARSVGRKSNSRTSLKRHQTFGERILLSKNEIEQTAEQIILCCGFGRTLVAGFKDALLVGAFIRRGVDAWGLADFGFGESRAEGCMHDRISKGSLLELPFLDGEFQTVVCGANLGLLASEDVPDAIREIHRVTERFAYLVIKTSQHFDSALNFHNSPREWWESICFETGFRKHPAYYRISHYDLLDQAGEEIVIPLEKLQTNALKQYPLQTLKAERDLHMDMLREAGSRSDAHVSRYYIASKYLRPGDKVVDAACGLGYGSHVVRRLTKISSVQGIDSSSFAVEYCNVNFRDDDSISFVQADLPKYLQSLPDNSVDAVICFETLEHLKQPKLMLAEVHRVLTPGGRFFASVPNDWSDESGEDPNPFHLHVYDKKRFLTELHDYFDIEHLLGQTADRVKDPNNGVQWVKRGRSIESLDLDNDDESTVAEWLIAIACKSPIGGESVPYVERVFSCGEIASAGNVLAFERDYRNPWLLRSLISIGLRTENRKLRQRWASETLETAPRDSSDYGSALCILAYLFLEGAQVSRQDELCKLIDDYQRLNPSPHSNVFRWQVSLSHVQGLIALAEGQRDKAKQYFHRVIGYPIIKYSPTLLTKSSEAAYLLGRLYAAEGETRTAESIWSDALNSLRNDIGQHLVASSHNLPPSFELREITTTLSITGRLVSAIRNAIRLSDRPSVFGDEVSSDFVARLSWLESQRNAWEQTALKQQKAVAELQNQFEDLLAVKNWFESQRDSWERTASERDETIKQLKSDLQGAMSGNAWLESQRDSWERTASERDKTILELGKYLEDLQIGNEWLESQRNAWEQTASGYAKVVTELQANNEEMQIGISWLESQCDSWENLVAEREAELDKIRSHWGVRFVNFLYRRGIF